MALIMKHKSEIHCKISYGIPLLVLLLLFNTTTLFAQPTMTDSRDGKTYKTMLIGEHTWMAQNLAFEGFGAKSYSVILNPNNPDFKKDSRGIFGLHYKIKDLFNGDYRQGTQGICPMGWHIPTKEELIALKEFILKNRLTYNQMLLYYNWFSKLDSEEEAVVTDQRIALIVSSTSDGSKNSEATPGFGYLELTINQGLKMATAPDDMQFQDSLEKAIHLENQGTYYPCRCVKN
jgi:uncharacterized protein (TIGR02145 family)